MTIEDLIQDIADESNGEVYSNYSGRGMFGKKCWGVYGDDPCAIIEEAAIRGFTGANMDSLGLQTIVYWPDVEDMDDLRLDEVKRTMDDLLVEIEED